MADPDLLLVIGDKNLSSWSLRPWLAMRHARVPFRERVLRLDTPEFHEAGRDLSPSRRVPALHDGHLVVWDSLAIAEYVAELFPDAGLWPDDRAARAVARSVSAEMHAGFPAMRRDLSLDVTARRARHALATDTEADVARFFALVEDCRARFGAGGPFLFGRFSIADAMYAPVAMRLRTYDVPVPSAVVRAYSDELLALDAVREWEREAAREVAEASRKPKAPAPSAARLVHAVVFSSTLRWDAGEHGYDEAARHMIELAEKQPGFLGIESARGPDGFGITVSYWESPEAIRRWREHPEHQKTQARGRTAFYERYDVRVCNVERAYRFDARAEAKAGSS